MNKRLLIISPYFPPSNAADMHRVRTSLPYFKKLGWDVEIVTVDSSFSEMVKDDLLLKSIPSEIPVHRVGAFSKQWTSKFGLGSLAIRSLWFYLQKVNDLLTTKKFNLIYFSTTAFPVCILGAYWKKKFGIPYVIDMQDPWHSDYYKDKPKDRQPPKYWFSYRLNKYLEPKAMKHVDGLIAVSDKYILDLKNRYQNLGNVPFSIIPFGAFGPDQTIARQNHSSFKKILAPGFTNIVYVGRGGTDMHQATSMLFQAIKTGVEHEPTVFENLRFYFIGTSYAPEGAGKPTIMPLAKEFGIEDKVIEMTDRLTFYHSLATLEDADALFIPGSDDPGYSASKVYPYLLTKKPLIAIFNESSNVVNMVKECTTSVNLYIFPGKESEQAKQLYGVLRNWGKGLFRPVTFTSNFDYYYTENLARLQTELFDKTIQYFERKNTNA